MPVAVATACSAPSSAAMRSSNAHGRVGVARIDVARHFAGKARSGVGSGAEHVAGGEEHRITVLAFRRTVLTGTHSQGVERYAFEVAVQPTGIPFLTHAVTPAF
jgi:hypothetical protein